MITHHARQIFSAYRKDEYADPDGFVMQLGAVLGRYPDSVIAYVCSPFTGVQRRPGPPPNINDVVAACEEAHNRELRITELGAMKLLPREPRPLPESRANVFVSRDLPIYRGVAEKAACADAREWHWCPHGAGIWVSRGLLESAGHGGG